MNQDPTPTPEKPKTKTKAKAKSTVGRKVNPVLADMAAPGPEKKSQETANLESLLEIVQAQADTIAKQQATTEDLQDLVNDLKARVTADEDAGEPVEREADVFVDPFEDHNALDFKVFRDEDGNLRVNDVIPPDSNFEFGRKLKWINPKLRDEIGMRGWIEVRFSDSFLLGPVMDFETGDVVETPGAKLGDYLNATPSRMEGGARRDDHIRRGDLVLCWIDMKVYIARMRRRDEDAQLKRGQLSNEADIYNVKGRRGAHVVGPGLTRDEDPNQSQRSEKRQYMPNIITDRAKYLPVTPTPSPEE